MGDSTNWWDDCRKWFLGLPPGARWATGIGFAFVVIMLVETLTSSTPPEYPSGPPVAPYSTMRANSGFNADRGYTPVNGDTPRANGGLPVVPGLPGPNGDGSYGPFATSRRAMEVVEMFQRMGYRNTIQYHNGDGQYVFPRP